MSKRTRIDHHPMAIALHPSIPPQAVGIIMPFFGVAELIGGFTIGSFVDAFGRSIGECPKRFCLAAPIPDTAPPPPPPPLPRLPPRPLLLCSSPSSSSSSSCCSPSSTLPHPTPPAQLAQRAQLVAVFCIAPAPAPRLAAQHANHPPVRTCVCVRRNRPGSWVRGGRGRAPADLPRKPRYRHLLRGLPQRGHALQEFPHPQVKG